MNPPSTTWAERLWRRWYWRGEYKTLRRTYGKVKHLVYFGGDGIGDELLCSTPLRELRLRHADKVGIMTSRPEFFRGSSDVDGIFGLAHADISLLRQLGVRVSHTGYISRQLPPDIDVPPARHILAEMCHGCGIHGDVTLRPYLRLTEEEKTAAQAYKDVIVVQASRRGASLQIGNKEWLPERMQQVVSALSVDHRVVQLGTIADPLLSGAEDLRGQTTLRESAAILSVSAFFLGFVGLMMHLARAVDRRAVIIFGGREHPRQSGYPCNENLFTDLPCSPCWRWNSCDHDRRCMSAIQVEHVLEAVRRIERRLGDPLETATAALP